MTRYVSIERIFVGWRTSESDTRALDYPDRRLPMWMHLICKSTNRFLVAEAVEGERDLEQIGFNTAFEHLEEARDLLLKFEVWASGGPPPWPGSDEKRGGWLFGVIRRGASK
jgi:hypothetical protein